MKNVDYITVAAILGWADQAMTEGCGEEADAPRGALKITAAFSSDYSVRPYL